MDDRRSILWQSLLLTVLIFSVGILLNHFFDVFRISTINDVMNEHELDREAYAVEHLFAENFGEETCEVMTARIFDLKEEIRKVGEDLGSYSRFSFFRKKDYDYLKRKYFLLELRFFSLVKEANNDCGKPYLPVLFFYEIDDEDSERQGFILQDLSKEYERELVVLSLDLDYEDEPLLDTIVRSYNISSGPSIIIDDEVYEGLLYAGELNASVRKFLRRPDPYAVDVDFSLVPNAAGVNVSELVFFYDNIIANESAGLWARGDALLVKSRLLSDDDGICKSLEFFDKIDSVNPEELALKFETIATLGCGRNRAAFLRAAAGEWVKAGNIYRAGLLQRLAEGNRLNLKFDDSALKADDKVLSGYVSPLSPVLPSDASAVIIGETAFVVNNDSVIVSQDDRVFRDWLGFQLASPFGPEFLRVFSERLKYNDSELRSDIGWHEGSRVSDLLRVNASFFPAVGTLVARRDNRWFAVDDSGVFRFEVPADKVSYPTARFLRRDLAVIIDTHGVNMLVEQAVRYNASIVLSDCDHPGKVYAAKYLSGKGIDIACFPDKYVFTAIGHNLSLIGSPPVAFYDNFAILGGRSITITSTDKIVAVNSSDSAYALWYYQTPASYFEVISEVLPLNVTYVSLDDFNQMSAVVDAAHKVNADILAVRVFSKDDYEWVKSWLLENQSNRAVLFHSASYPYGQLIFNEFVNQTSFDDPNPVWVYEK